MGKKNVVVYVALIFAMVFWSFSFVWVKEVYMAYGPLTTVFFRLIIATAIMLIVGKLLNKIEKIKKVDYRTFLLLTFFEPFLYFLGESFGLLYVTSTMGAIIIATIPLFSPLAASRYHGETLSLRNLIGIIISFIGVGIVVFDGAFNFVASPLGIALEFLAVASAIGYTVVLKKLSVKYNATTIVTYQNFIGLFFFLPLWLIFEGKQLISTPFNFPAFWAIVKLALFASCIAFLLYTYSVKNLGINRANMYINLIPVLTALFAWYILDEQLTIRKLGGISVVVLGLFVAQVKLKKSVGRLISIQQDGGR